MTSASSRNLARLARFPDCSGKNLLQSNLAVQLGVERDADHADASASVRPQEVKTSAGGRRLTETEAQVGRCLGIEGRFRRSGQRGRGDRSRAPPGVYRELSQGGVEFGLADAAKARHEGRRRGREPRRDFARGCRRVSRDGGAPGSRASRGLRDSECPGRRETGPASWTCCATSAGRRRGGRLLDQAEL